MLDLEMLLADEKNEFKVCDKCKATNINSLIPKLQKLDAEANVKIGCHSFCGPGRNQPFVIVNNKPIMASSEDELVEKVADTIYV